MEKSIYYIYKLNVLDEFYIGSTRDIAQRFRAHKSECKIESSKHKKVYVKMNEVYNLNDTHLLNYEILETITCTKCESRNREQYYIDNLKPQLNTINAVFNIKSHREKCKLYMREIRMLETESAHEQRLKRKKIWYDKNRELILSKERNRYNKKKISDMKGKMKLMKQNLDSISMLTTI